MADTLITSVSRDEWHRFRSRSNIVWVNSEVGYSFYLRVGGGAGDTIALQYIKTTDNGDNWATEVTVHSSGNSAWALEGFDVWWDKWTPNDTGTLIHITVQGRQSGSQTYTTYYTLDTNNSDTLVQVEDRYSLTSGAPIGRTVAMVKMEDATLYSAFVIATHTHKVFTSTDAGVSWVAIANPGEDYQYDKHVLYPTASSDNKDLLRIVWDALTNHIFALVWDNSALAWTASVSLGSSGDFVDNVVQQGWSSTFRLSDKTAIVIAHESMVGASHDLRAFSVNWDGATLTVTELGKIFTAQTYGYGAAITIDNNTDRLYAYYMVGSFGSQYIATKTSTDGGVTWGTETQHSQDTTDYHNVWACMSIVGRGMLFPLYGNTAGAHETHYHNGGDIVVNPDDGIPVGPPGPIFFPGGGTGAEARQFNNLIIDIAQDILDPPGQTLTLNVNPGVLTLTDQSEGNLVIMVNDKP